MAIFWIDFGNWFTGLQKGGHCPSLTNFLIRHYQTIPQKLVWLPVQHLINFLDNSTFMVTGANSALWPLKIWMKLINQSINQSIVWLIEILLTNLFRATVNWTVHFPFKHCLSVQHLIVLMAERKSVWLNRIHCYPGIHMKVNAWRQLVLNWTNALAGLIRCNAGVITGIRSVCGRPTPFCTIWSIEIANCCPDRSLLIGLIGCWLIGCMCILQPTCDIGWSIKCQGGNNETEELIL